MKKIYIVDDNYIILDLLQDILEEDSYDIRTFIQAEPVLRESLNAPPDLFLLDIRMPGMDGISLCRKIKETKELEIIPVIFISGMIDSNEKVLAFEAGGADFITKPFISIDIQSRVRTQLKLKEFLDQTLSFNMALEDGISQRTIELQKAKEDAEKANREKDQFLSNINHELRTPLNGILGMLDLMKQKKPEDEELSLNIDLADYAAKQLSYLINDILDYMQLENKSMLFSYKTFSLSKLLNKLNHIYAPQCHEKGLDIRIESLPEDTFFAGDENRILQILNNLLTNSIKYSLTGTISIKCVLDDELEIQVQDQGVGISEEQRPEIFKPYVQLQHSYLREKQGLGLGLAITQDLLEQMDGSIDLQSTAEGSLFTVRIPPHKEEGDAAPLMSFQSGKGNGEIFIAEDDSISLYYMENVLEDAGYSVTTAINGKEAMEELKEKPYDLILLDISLPSYSGLQIMKELKQSCDTPVLAVTAYCQDSDIRQFKEAGFKDVISKPVHSSKLLEVVRTFLSEK
ncbi:MAG: hypothetical protein B6241_15265 [Spirochaetaceae bacterium 4572_59]|nr:MAG: hypothetical protein B6241_15265 [Spirochaetaceae bacterium 4572_59]